MLQYLNPYARATPRHACFITQFTDSMPAYKHYHDKRSCTILHDNVNLCTGHDAKNGTRRNEKALDLKTRGKLNKLEEIQPRRKMSKQLELSRPGNVPKGRMPVKCL
ncbi:hypothetical protein AVEN_94642-1 [Araneus ventricosus]|uniref:Uncharacterized protein n=1 Tax=Araneus ventricosus TaxID=182803 RepID=A0A4Y2X3J3_ARAVE|nr:hypothetical protein AVEN_94642-1 [Araneus ventricosus]